MLIDQPTFNLLQKTIKRVGWLQLPATGNSMFPFIHKGDLCRFNVCEPASIKKGDVILYLSPNGQLVAHRFVKSTMILNQQMFLFKGDTNLGIDEPIHPERILGKLVSIKKKQWKITTEHFFVQLWGTMILEFPILSGLLRKYLNRRLRITM
jgi:signal peptidase I